MCWRPLRILLREPSGLSCEIVSDLCPNPFSHDWHVQPSCQRPNHVPPERREFSPAGHTPSASPTVLETLQTYRAAQSPVNGSIPQNFHLISTRGMVPDGGRGCSRGFKVFETLKLCHSETCLLARSNMAFRSRKRLITQGFLSHARAEDRKLGKELTFGGPCLEGTLQKPTGVSESSPVAGAIKGSTPYKP